MEKPDPLPAFGGEGSRAQRGVEDGAKGGAAVASTGNHHDARSLSPLFQLVLTIPQESLLDFTLKTNSK